MKNQLFKDLKVVELASVLAGPAVGLFFAAAMQLLFLAGSLR